MILFSIWIIFIGVFGMNNNLKHYEKHQSDLNPYSKLLKWRLFNLVSFFCWAYDGLLILVRTVGLNSAYFMSAFSNPLPDNLGFNYPSIHNCANYGPGAPSWKILHFGASREFWGFSYKHVVTSVHLSILKKNWKKFCQNCVDSAT